VQSAPSVHVRAHAKGLAQGAGDNGGLAPWAPWLQPAFAAGPRCTAETRARTDPMPCTALSTKVLFFSSSPSLSLVFPRLPVAPTQHHGAVRSRTHASFVREARRSAHEPQAALLGRAVDSRGVDEGKQGVGWGGGGERVNVGPESPPPFDFLHAPFPRFALKTAPPSNRATGVYVIRYLYGL
jgi:hypothetical protein